MGIHCLNGHENGCDDSIIPSDEIKTMMNLASIGLIEKVQ